MGWEQRGDGFYYYRKIRRGQRVVSEYVGAGETAELIYALDVSDQQQREQQRQELREEKSKIETVDLEIEELNKLLQSLALAILLVSGYHPHKGQWRKVRNG